MQFLSSPIRRLSALAGLFGAGLLITSFVEYFAFSDYHTLLTWTRYYQWTNQADGSVMTKRRITVDVDCAKPIVAAAFQKWKLAHPGEFDIVMTLGAPSFYLQNDHVFIEGVSYKDWSNLGIYNLDEATLGQLQRDCFGLPLFMRIWTDLCFIRILDAGQVTKLSGFA